MKASTALLLGVVGLLALQLKRERNTPRQSGFVSAQPRPVDNLLGIRQSPVNTPRTNAQRDVFDVLGI